MKKLNRKLIAGLAVLALGFAACTSDLDTEPKVELSLENLLAKDPNAVEGLLSKMYGTFALSGAGGPNTSDITGPDPGETAFLRSILNLQDFTADGMKNRWGDDGLDQLTTTSNWDANNKFFKYLYDRVYYIAPQTTNLIMALESVDVANEEQIIGELRFIRALAYYYMIDCFGKGVLINEENYGATDPLPESSRVELFNFVEQELKIAEQSVPLTNSYGRANKHVVRMLLAKLYLNAEVYTGTPRYSEALAYIEMVINEGGYSLTDHFLQNFSGDNSNPELKEIIFPLIADPVVSQSYGNTTYIVNGSTSVETMNILDFGTTDGWTGHRATKAWYSLYGDISTSPDDRADLFWISGHQYEMEDYKNWQHGYPSIKFRNTNFNGTSIATAFSGTDFPLFRLADAYLMYAECVLRGGGGSAATALDYVNDVRTRSNAPEITEAQLTLDFILDERARELNLEGHRRTDLIRFGKFTGSSYIWPWKGGVQNGTSIPVTYNLFPIPQNALQANPNLTQNPGF